MRINLWSTFFIIYIQTYSFIYSVNRHVREAIVSSRMGRFLNPSRICPSRVAVQRPLSDGGQRTALYAIAANSSNRNDYALFTSVIVCVSSNLHEPDPPSPFHYISGRLCKQEWERFCAFFCAVFKEPELRAQVYENAISFSTRARPRDAPGEYLSTCIQFHWLIFLILSENHPVPVLNQFFLLSTLPDLP